MVPAMLRRMALAMTILARVPLTPTVTTISLMGRHSPSSYRQRHSSTATARTLFYRTTSVATAAM
jgi:hypothetical protein